MLGVVLRFVRLGRGSLLIHRKRSWCSSVLNLWIANLVFRMGLTPLAGLPGATRSGSIDPSWVSPSSIVGTEILNILQTCIPLHQRSRKPEPCQHQRNAHQHGRRHPKQTIRLENPNRHHGFLGNRSPKPAIPRAQARLRHHGRPHPRLHRELLCQAGRAGRRAGFRRRDRREEPYVAEGTCWEESELGVCGWWFPEWEGTQGGDGDGYFPWVGVFGEEGVHLSDEWAVWNDL